MNYKNIYKQNGRYIIKKNIYAKTIVYGSFEKLETAIEQRNILIKNRWYKNATTGYPKQQHFPKYQVKETEYGYLVINRKNGKTFGTYTNHRYATIIKKILPFYEDDIKIQNIERIANREFYKYIIYNKRLGRYFVNYKGVIRATFSELKDALYERDLIIRYDGDEELMCEDPTIVHDYEKEELPPFKQESGNIRYRDENKNKYQLEKQIRNKRIVIGSYPTYDLALLIKKYLEKKKWDTKEIKHIIKTTRSIHKRDKYIYKYNGRYTIRKIQDDKLVTYGTYTDLDLARYVKNNLSTNNWRKKMIKKYEKRYYKNNIKTEYFYDNTDFFTDTSV